MITVPDQFYSTLQEKYRTALAGGHLTFDGESASHELIDYKINDKTFQCHLTELKSLEHRPEKGTVAKNPFAKPEPELTILSEFGEKNEFKLVLNKFPVVPAHFMLVTNTFISQNTPLSPSELSAIYALLMGLKSDGEGKNWFAFYNCGPESGASQPHKHVQFMPLPTNYQPFTAKIVETSESFIPDQTHEPLQDADIPFAHFVAKLPSEKEKLTEEYLAMTFVSLLQRTLSVLKAHDANHISYNFCATTNYMMLVPRSSAKFDETLGINSCGVLGLILSKNDGTTALIKSTGFMSILEAVGFPKTAGEASNEYMY